MPMSTTSLRIASDPCLSVQIIKYCNSQIPGKDQWQWESVKEGVQKVMLCQMVAMVAVTVIVLSQPYSEELWSVGLVAIAGLTLSYTLYELEAQAAKIAGIIAPHLKITCCGVRPIRLVVPLREGLQGTDNGVGYGTRGPSHTAIKVSPSSTEE